MSRKLRRDGAVTFDGTDHRSPAPVHELASIAVLGAGRLGTALSGALGTPPPLRRGETPPAGADCVLLCVPDGEIAAAAAAIAPGPLVGHCSGATTLAPLLAAGHEAFSLHPLMTIPAGGRPPLAGATAAVAGSAAPAPGAPRGAPQRPGERPRRAAG